METVPDFIWRDAGRLVVFRGGALGAAPQLLAEHGFDSFELLSTERALSGAPGLSERAGTVHLVAPGGVPDAAAEILDAAEGAEHLVALGGGRVIDTAKAVAAVSGAAVAAIPTTMSGAEMTAIHRLPAGAEDRAGGLVRPSVVIADPEPMTSQAEARLRASSMNALAHGADSLYTPYANPVSRITALRGAGLIAAALDREREERDRRALALGSILSGYAIDSALFALHHVICQTLVRVCGSSHAETNAVILPRAMAAMRERAPAEIGALAGALGTDAVGIEERILVLGGEPAGLGAAGAERSRLEEALDAIEARPELGFTPDPPGREELRRIIEAAW
jgi:alcohol dehydrogenase class IV